MTDERFEDSKRFIFKRKIDGYMYLVDCKKEYSSVKLTDRLAEILSKILWEHTQLIDEKEKGLFKLNNLRDFVKENSDLGNDVLFELIKYGSD